jgi:hypothetical protein
MRVPACLPSSLPFFACVLSAGGILTSGTAHASGGILGAAVGM